MISLLSNTTKCTKLTLCIFSAKHEIHHFPQNPGFICLLSRKGYVFTSSHLPFLLILPENTDYETKNYFKEETSNTSQQPFGDDR